MPSLQKLLCPPMCSWRWQGGTARGAGKPWEPTSACWPSCQSSVDGQPQPLHGSGLFFLRLSFETFQGLLISMHSGPGRSRPQLWPTCAMLLPPQENSSFVKKMRIFLSLQPLPCLLDLYSKNDGHSLRLSSQVLYFLKPFPAGIISSSSCHLPKPFVPSAMMTFLILHSTYLILSYILKHRPNTFFLYKDKNKILPDSYHTSFKHSTPKLIPISNFFGGFPEISIKQAYMWMWLCIVSYLIQNVSYKVIALQLALFPYWTSLFLQKNSLH